jgi:hypothetical protein
MCSGCGLLSARYVQGVGYCQQERCGRLVGCTGCSLWRHTWLKHIQIYRLRYLLSSDSSQLLKILSFDSSQLLKPTIKISAMFRQFNFWQHCIEIIYLLRQLKYMVKLYTRKMFRKSWSLKHVVHWRVVGFSEVWSSSKGDRFIEG